MATLAASDRDVVRAAIDRYGPPAMRGDAALPSRDDCTTDAESRVASPRIAREQLVKELVVERPAKRGRCSYCGHRTRKRDGACHAHGDLPELEREIFRDFCDALKAEAAA